MPDQTARTTEFYDAIDAFQRTHRLPGLQHAQLRGLLAEHLARAFPAVSLPPATDKTDDAPTGADEPLQREAHGATRATNQTERCDRYAKAMAQRDGHPWPTEFEDDERDYRRRGQAAAAVADAEQAELRRERDLAIAHDRQPYPTAWAYEQACKALRKHRERADAAETRVAELEQAAASAVGRPDLRDQIADALLDHLSRTADIRPGRDGQLAFMPEVSDAERLRIADAVVAVLPADQRAADRGAVSAALWAAAEHHTIAEWICCEPIDSTHALCVQGGVALRMLKALLVDDPDAWKPAPLLDQVMGFLSPDVSTAEVHRLALSETLDLGTGAPWDAIHDRVAELRRMADCPACVARIEHDEHCPTPESHNWGRGCPTDQTLRRVAGEEPHTTGPEAHPAEHSWAAELHDPLADEWVPGTRYRDRERAVAALEHGRRIGPTWKDGAPTERRLVRATTTYTIEPPAASAVPAAPDTDVDRLQVWPLQRVLTEVRCGSQDWTWDEEWADLDRRHAETGYLATLEQQIRERGITMPVLIGSDGRLWDGHHRLRLAVRLGIDYVPVEITPAAPDTEAKPTVGYSGKGRVWCLTCPRPDRENVPITADVLAPYEECAGCHRCVVDVVTAPDTEAVHLGGGANAEDCPACKAERRNLPYPFTCPGPSTGTEA